MLDVYRELSEEDQKLVDGILFAIPPEEPE